MAQPERYALVDIATQKVVNIIMYAVGDDYEPDPGQELVFAEGQGNIGDTWDGNEFIPGPVAPTTPTIVAGPALGTNPPTPSIVGDDNLGIIRVGTGAAPPIGVALVITFAKPRAVAPLILLTSLAAGVVTKFPYVSASSPTGFSISVAAAIGANVAPGDYLTYQVYGG